jgi:hypothetical protein
VTNAEPSSSEGQARAFGEWKVWFGWGSMRSDDPGEGVPPAWFVRHGSSPPEAIPAIDLTEAEFRSRLGELMDASTVEAVCQDFEPRITATALGQVLAPRPRR